MNIAICFGNIESSKEISIKYFVTVQILITNEITKIYLQEIIDFLLYLYL